MTLSAIVLAAGKATRMKSDLVKVLHPICGRPMLSYVLDACRDAGVKNLYVVIGHDRQLAIAPHSLLAVFSAGAYGMSMSSNYNTRPRAAEVMVDGDAVHLVRERETVKHLLTGESLVP